MILALLAPLFCWLLWQSSPFNHSPFVPLGAFFAFLVALLINLLTYLEGVAIRNCIIGIASRIREYEEKHQERTDEDLYAQYAREIRILRVNAIGGVLFNFAWRVLEWSRNLLVHLSKRKLDPGHQEFHQLQRYMNSSTVKRKRQDHRPRHPNLALPNPQADEESDESNMDEDTGPFQTSTRG